MTESARAPPPPAPVRAQVHQESGVEGSAELLAQLKQGGIKPEALQGAP